MRTRRGAQSARRSRGQSWVAGGASAPGLPPGLFRVHRLAGCRVQEMGRLAGPQPGADPSASWAVSGAASPSAPWYSCVSGCLVRSVTPGPVSAWQGSGGVCGADGCSLAVWRYALVPARAAEVALRRVLSSCRGCTDAGVRGSRCRGRRADSAQGQHTHKPQLCAPERRDPCLRLGLFTECVSPKLTH